ISVPAGFSPGGKTVRVLIGGLDKSYTLGPKGVSADKAFGLKSKLVNGNAIYSFSLKKQNLFAPLEDLGFTKTQNNPAAPFPVVIVLDGARFLDDGTIGYTVKGNAKGPQSGKGKK